LYIVKHIVEAHGGSVEVSSSAADGTTFSVRWPKG
jgi:signal transduction histidine kinase